MRILIADDDFANQKFMGKLLSMYGEVVVVDNGMSAVDEVVKGLEAGESFGLICLDVMMTRLDGYKTLEAIREAERKYAVSNENRSKVMMLSGLDEDIQDTIRVCDDYDLYVCKPILIDVFFKQLEQMGFQQIV